MVLRSHPALALAGAALLFMAACTLMPTESPDSLDPGVNLSDAGDWYQLLPNGPASGTALIFYPGALVDPPAYFHHLQALVMAGHPAYVTKMPLNLAIFDPERALRIIDAHPEQTRWAIAGHSLGGAMAASTVHAHPDRFAGIAFWAAYPAAADSLAAIDLPALSISAELDGLATPAKIQAAAAYYPPRTTQLVIAGGNHAQFGAYGTQNGDNAATISLDEQRRQIVAAMLSFLANLGP